MSALLQALDQLAERPNRRLDKALLQRVAREIFLGEASAPRIAAFLMALRVVGETGAEIEAFVEIMLENATPFPRPAGIDVLLDTCGTGGDRLQTFNVSTAVALVVAAAGVKVAKHGNRSASSKCGSADVLEHLGFRLELSPEQSAAMLGEHGFCFLFARSYHPAMRHAAEARGELKLRTLFNLCGPLSNPAQPTHQLVGVSSRDLMDPVANGLRNLGARRALVVHGMDGMDEISLTQATEGIHLDDDGKLHYWHCAPADFGLHAVEVADLQGGDVAENGRLLRDVLEGKPGPHADLVAINAGAALWISGLDRDMKAGCSRARDLLKSGEAARLLDRCIAASKPSKSQ